MPYEPKLNRHLNFNGPSHRPTRHKRQGFWGTKKSQGVIKRGVLPSLRVSHYIISQNGVLNRILFVIVIRKGGNFWHANLFKFWDLGRNRVGETT